MARSKPKHSPGGLVGNYQESEREQCTTPQPGTRQDDLGRPNPNEDKDLNAEQLKSKDRAAAGAGVGQPGRTQSAERVDPSGKTRAGERR